MYAFKTQQLNDHQLAGWKDSEFIDASKFNAICRKIDQLFPDGRFRFLDIGCGNGRFSDQILATYPYAEGMVVDNSTVLLEQNRLHPRKRAVPAAVEELEGVITERFDLIFMNYLLHHLIDARSYRTTKRNQVLGLKVAGSLLRPGGQLSIFEHLYDGALFDGLPGLLIYKLTASRLLEPVTRRMGAHTAGVGVCFQSKRQWEEALATAGLVVDAFEEHEPLNIPVYKKLLLHLGAVRGGHFWCRAD